MPAYVIANISVTQPERYEEYKRRAEDTLAAHGGRYLARGGEVQVLEGDWQPRRLVILEFPTLAQARGWYDSHEYAAARDIRLATATGDIVLLEGL